MTIKFDKDLAMLVGVIGAVAYEYIKQGCRESALEHNHYHQGFYWTKMSVRELKEKMPYCSPHEIMTGLGYLVSSGVIMVGHYGGGTRAKWYAVIKKYGG